MNEKVEIKNNLNISNYNDEDLIKLFKTLSLEHKRDCFKAYFLYIMMTKDQQAMCLYLYKLSYNAANKTKPSKRDDNNEQ